MWQAQLNALGAGSPLRPLAAGQLARLDRELGHLGNGAVFHADIKSAGRRNR
jgi:hypothetical protein